jgi:proton translocating ATP synthase F1 alpha subunit
VVLKADSKVKENFFVLSSGVVISMLMGYPLLGHVLDGMGRGKIPFIGMSKNNLHLKRLDIKAPGILARASINEPLQTGIRSVDGMFPIGRGQRELIIGDRQTGKTALTLDTILNQKNYNLYDNFTQLFCVYCAIGQKQSSIAQVTNHFRLVNSLAYSIILTTSSSDPAALQYLTPFSGSTVAEFFRDSGEHALIIMDDLSKQAAAYRQIALILKRPPGREAYPGDVFYLHARLLERASKLSFSFGGGSLTCLPIVETQLGDVSAYIPTNVISITDGQIFLESKLFNKGIRPAISTGLSVSRVGSLAQTKLLREVSTKLKLELAQFREVEGFSFLGAELDAPTLFIVTRGLIIQELLKQPKNCPVPVEYNILFIFAAMRGWFDSLAPLAARGFMDFLQTLFNKYNIQDFINTFSNTTSIAAFSKHLILDAKAFYVSKQFFI